jgi:hypothetical protein
VDQERASNRAMRYRNESLKRAAISRDLACASHYRTYDAVNSATDKTA